MRTIVEILSLFESLVDKERVTVITNDKPECTLENYFGIIDAPDVTVKRGIYVYDLYDPMYLSYAEGEKHTAEIYHTKTGCEITFFEL